MGLLAGLRSGAAAAAVVFKTAASALVAQTPDSGIAGGNVRGTNAVDFQMVRDAATQVASGNESFIGGGQRHTATGANTTIAGGMANSATAFNAASLSGNGCVASGAYAVVVGGQSNTGSGAHSFLGGGINNTVGGQYGVVGGGQSNAASQTHSTIAGGTSNSVTGVKATIGGGTTNSAGDTSTVAGGNSNSAPGTVSWCPGGWSSTSRGHFGRGSWASGSFATQGDAQAVEFVVRRASTDATGVVLTQDGSTPFGVSNINLPANAMMRLRLSVAALQTGGTAGTAGDCASWDVEVVLKRIGVAANTTIVSAYTLALGAINGVTPGVGFGTANRDTGAANWLLTIAADTGNAGLTITGTGEANKNIRWVGRVSGVEVTF